MVPGCCCWGKNCSDAAVDSAGSGLKVSTSDTDALAAYSSLAVYEPSRIRLIG